MTAHATLSSLITLWDPTFAHRGTGADSFDCPRSLLSFRSPADLSRTIGTLRDHSHRSRSFFSFGFVLVDKISQLSASSARTLFFASGHSGTREELPHPFSAPWGLACQISPCLRRIIPRFTSLLPLHTHFLPFDCEFGLEARATPGLPSRGPPTSPRSCLVTREPRPVPAVHRFASTLPAARVSGKPSSLAPRKGPSAAPTRCRATASDAMATKPKTIYRKDYQPVAYNVDTVDMTFKLDEDFSLVTTVQASPPRQRPLPGPGISAPRGHCAPRGSAMSRATTHPYPSSPSPPAEHGPCDPRPGPPAQSRAGRRLARAPGRREGRGREPLRAL